MAFINAGFQDPDVNVEEGEIEFGSLAEAAGVVAAAPFGEELQADGELWAGAYTRSLLSSTKAVLVTPLRVPLFNRLGENHAPNVPNKCCLG
jgi:hypothetical protein